MNHSEIPGAGRIGHDQIDRRLPTNSQAKTLRTLDSGAPQTVSGARDDPEAALAHLLAALAALGLIADNTTAS